jgi:GNAT superfamily N-acetyltransferase
MTGLRIERISRGHAVDDFDCGRDELNRFLIRFALANDQAGAARTYVAVNGRETVGFYTLTVGQVSYDGAPARLTRGLARHPVPIMLLARLAVSIPWQGRAIGAGLLKDAMRRTLQAADIAGIRALAVHAKDEAARKFYEHFDFVPSPTDPLHLFLLLKDLRHIADGG